jgi:hypothetical protein
MKTKTHFQGGAYAIALACMRAQKHTYTHPHEQVKTLFAESDAPSSVTSAAKGMCVGVEVAGTGSIEGAREAIQTAQGSAYAYSSGSQKAAQYEINVFFEQVVTRARIILRIYKHPAQL